MIKFNRIAPYGVIFLILAIFILILTSAGKLLVIEGKPVIILQIA